MPKHDGCTMSNVQHSGASWFQSSFAEMWNVQRSIQMVFGICRWDFLPPIIFVSIVCIPMFFIMLSQRLNAVKCWMLHHSLSFDAHNFISFCLWNDCEFSLLCYQIDAIDCSVKANRKFANVWHSYVSVWMRWAMRSVCDFFGNISTMPKIFEVFYVCPFFWFSFSVGSPHEASNCGALLRQANTKCDITRGVVLRSASITEQQINDWKKLMSFPHQIVFSLATVLQWIYVRIMKNLFNQRIAI